MLVSHVDTWPRAGPAWCSQLSLGGWSEPSHRRSWLWWTYPIPMCQESIVRTPRTQNKRSQATVWSNNCPWMRDHKSMFCPKDVAFPDYLLVLPLTGCQVSWWTRLCCSTSHVESRFLSQKEPALQDSSLGLKYSNEYMCNVYTYYISCTLILAWTCPCQVGG